MRGVALKASFSMEECFGAIVRTYTISRSAAVVPRSNCERRRRCSSRYCWLTRGANSPGYYVIGQWCLPCRVRRKTDRCALRSRYSDAFLMGCLAQGNDPQCQQEDRFQYGRSLINVNIYTISLTFHGKAYLRAERGVLEHNRTVTELLYETIFPLDG